MQEEINVVFARRKAKVMLRFLLAVLLSSSIIILVCFYITLNAFEKKLNHISEKIAKLSEKSASTVDILATPLQQDTSNTDSEYKIQGSNTINDTIFIRDLVFERSPVHIARSEMYLSKSDSVYIHAADKRYSYPANRRNFSSGMLNTKDRSLFAPIRFPFQIIDSRIVLDGTLRDPEGDVFLHMRNDSLIPVKPKDPKPGYGDINYIFTKENIQITDPYGNIALLIRRVHGGNGSSVQVAGYWWIIPNQIVGVVGMKGNEIIKKENVSRDFLKVYKELSIESPFRYENGKIVGEKRATTIPPKAI